VVISLMVLRRYRKLFFIGLAGAAAVVVFALLAIGALRGNFLWDLAAVDSPVRLRWNLWMAGLAMWGRHWLMGIGLGNFHIGFLPFLGPGVRQTKYLHNSYIQLPIELGLLGLVLVIVVVGLLVRRLLRATAESKAAGKVGEGPRQDPLHYGLIVAVLVFLVANGVEIILYFHSVGLLGAFLIGMFLRRSAPDHTAAAPSTDSSGKSGAMRIALAVLFIAAIVLVGRWFVADYFYLKGLEQVTRASLEPQIGDPGAPVAGSEGDPATVEDRIDRWKSIVDLASVAVAIEDGNSDYHYLLGRSYERLAVLSKNLDLLEQAQRHFSRAVELCPRMPYLRYSYGVILLRRGKLLSATREVGTAVSLYPGSEEYRSALEILEKRVAIVRAANRRQASGDSR